MDFAKVAVGEVALIPLIVGVIQYVKSFFPQAPSNAWRAASFLLALPLQFVVFLIGHGGNAFGWDIGTWLLCGVLAFGFALAAGKAYDETLGQQIQKF